MSEKYKAHAPNGLYHMTMTVVGWIDVFTRSSYADLVLESLRYCQKHKGLTIYGYVIMSNHIHLVAWVDAPNTMSTVIRDFKKFTARQILNAIETGPESRKEWMLHQFEFFAKKHSNREKYQFWQDGFHPVQLWTPEVIEQKINYLHYNPVRAGYVREPQDWVYSSAVDYWGGKGLIEVEHYFSPIFRTVK